MPGWRIDSAIYQHEAQEVKGGKSVTDLFGYKQGAEVLGCIVDAQVIHVCHTKIVIVLNYTHRKTALLNLSGSGVYLILDVLADDARVGNNNVEVGAKGLGRRIGKSLDRFGITSVAGLGENINMGVDRFEFRGELIEIGLGSGGYTYAYRQVLVHWRRTMRKEREEWSTCCASLGVGHTNASAQPFASSWQTSEQKIRMHMGDFGPVTTTLNGCPWGGLLFSGRVGPDGRVISTDYSKS